MIDDKNMNGRKKRERYVSIPLFVLLVFAFTASAGGGFVSPATAQPSPSLATQDPINHWKLDESTGTNAPDAAGSEDGTLVGGPVWHPVDGYFGGALEFDGDDDYVDLGTMDVPATNGLTLAFWFKADDFGVTDTRFISKASGTSGSDHYWMVSTLNSSTLRFRLKTGGVTTTLVSGTGEVVPGQWYHIAATYDGSKMRIFKNGVQVAIGDKTGTIDTNASVGAALGNQPVSGGGGKALDGLLDDVRIYDRGLSAGEVLALAQEGTIQSDDFYSTEFDTDLWRFVDPVGDGTLLASGTNVVVSVPGGTKHNLSSTTGIGAPHILQKAANTDFEIEAKFDSRGSRTYSGQGIMVKQDADTYLRFELIFTSSGVSVYSAYMDGASSATKINTSLTGGTPSYLRVRRTGDTWDFEYSYNGSSWTSAGSFSQAFGVSDVGALLQQHGEFGSVLADACVYRKRGLFLQYGKPDLSGRRRECELGDTACCRGVVRSKPGLRPQRDSSELGQHTWTRVGHRRGGHTLLHPQQRTGFGLDTGTRREAPRGRPGLQHRTRL